ncbi:hypothetical protein RC180_003459 [Salmonella enterica]|uniref:hypothetical protein n=1 Tax=Escherichia coli TaxID=562 RepID=UPI000209CD0A|nr:hypothetical protein [Escherichia coli]EEE0988501.1 hypothetical protein [Salmonella enterica subsp. enterica serovar Kiambu]EHF0053375.1 hypothetical protein [Salmonella enterica]HAT1637787.1 hypothetical protein [Raoultella planticola]EGI25731.1 conserved hypothetical protein [Escherichia coli TA206]ELE4479435.1 hypothetical protein [Salmonella enterica]
MKNRKNLFNVTTTEKIIADDFSDAVVNGLTHHVPGITKLILSCYRAGCTVVEITLYRENGELFILTVWEGGLDVPPFSPDDIRLKHKEISLPDITDILILVTRLARYAGLSPVLPADTDSSSLLEFNS